MAWFPSRARDKITNWLTMNDCIVLQKQKTAQMSARVCKWHGCFQVPSKPEKTRTNRQTETTAILTQQKAPHDLSGLNKQALTPAATQSFSCTSVRVMTVNIAASTSKTTQIQSSLLEPKQISIADSMTHHADKPRMPRFRNNRKSKNRRAQRD